MTSEGFRGSFPERVVDDLTAAMGIENRLGALDGAKVGAPPRVTWAPVNGGGVTLEPCPFHVPGVTVLSRQVLRFDVELWAESFGELTELHKHFAGKLDLTLGPAQGSAGDSLATSRGGYQIGEPTKQGPVGDTEGRSGSWAMVVPVAIKDFVVRETLGVAAGGATLAVTPQSPAGLAGTSATFLDGGLP